MKKLQITIADDNPALLQQLADFIIDESCSKGVNYIMVKPFNVGVIAGKAEHVRDAIGKDKKIKESKPDVDMIIAEKLNQIGIPASLKGYRYICTAIKEVLKDEMALEGITKVLYPNVAKKHNSTSQRVEKAIRHAIEVAWSRNEESELKKEFKFSKGSGRMRPTNSEFIAVLSQNIRRSV